ncbi:hypothetical protein D3C87_1099580 [compost metagenome]
MIRNCDVFNFSTTVCPTRSVLRVAAHVFPASSTIAASNASSGRSSANVSSDEIDCTGWSGSTARSSIPRARLYNRAPKLPNRPSSCSNGSARRSPTVTIPSSASLASITLPTPGTRLTGNGVRKRSTRCGGTTN